MFSLFKWNGDQTCFFQILCWPFGGKTTHISCVEIIHGIQDHQALPWVPTIRCCCCGALSWSRITHSNPCHGEGGRELRSWICAARAAYFFVEDIFSWWILLNLPVCFLHFQEGSERCFQQDVLENQVPFFFPVHKQHDTAGRDLYHNWVVIQGEWYL